MDCCIVGCFDFLYFWFNVQYVFYWSLLLAQLGYEYVFYSEWVFYKEDFLFLGEERYELYCRFGIGFVLGGI